MDVLVRLLAALLMLVIPAAAVLTAAARMRLPARLFIIGAATFIGSQVLHIPFNELALKPLIERMSLNAPGELEALLAVALLLGLSAGLFEESARALVYGLWLRRERSWREAIGYGLGHGGVEAGLLGALMLVTLARLLALREVDLATVFPAEQLALAQAQIAAYWGAAWHQTLAAPVERALAMCLHVGLSLLVMQAFLRRNAMWWLAAVALHTLANAAALVALAQWGVWPAEGVVALAALISLGLVIGLHTPEAAAPASPPAPPPPPGFEGLPPPDPTPARLDDSRYDAG